eukprot:TRINITY_DN10715_c0_g1_i1.p1 TRINITY_DN10715_c0_g1~~TRINITY_DN10715_c0_g1_i1.p1  ORF type:complete len:179 (+),score=4.27 TRINITY_DN10715_c0_g1_i1:79-537(+)
MATDRSSFVAELRSAAQVSSDVDDATLLRFLRARKYDVKKACAMYTACEAWRSKHRPSHIAEHEIQEELITGKSFIHGRDRAGRPCIIVNSVLHITAERNHDQTLKFALWSLERAIARLSIGETFTVILDRRGATRANFDLSITFACSVSFG